MYTNLTSTIIRFYPNHRINRLIMTCEYIPGTSRNTLKHLQDKNKTTLIKLYLTILLSPKLNQYFYVIY